MFKTPEKPSAGRGGGSSTSKKGSSHKTKQAQMSRQHVEQVEANLQNGAYARAFRGLSTMLAGRYKPGRNLYAIIWHWMLVAKTPSDAHQCYEALKLLQASFPASSAGEADTTGWCPRDQADYALLLECLQRTRPEEEDEDAEDARRKQASQFPQFISVVTTHGDKCKMYAKGPVVTEPLSEAGASKCRNAHGCTRQEVPSPYFPLLLQFLVQLLTENARTLRPDQYRSSAVMEMLMPNGNTSNWTEVAAIVMEGIGSGQLPRQVSDSYFALLHLLVDVCGNRAMPEFENSVFVWLSGTGVPVLESASGNNVNDRLAELLQRSKWCSMKLQFVNAILMTRFGAVENVRKRGEAPLDLHSKAKQGERLVHGYFHLKAQTGLAVGASSEDRSFDNESLVILVTSAWQSAKALQQEMPALWEYLMQNLEQIRSGFKMFQDKIARLSRLRTAHEGESERILLYMCLLNALIEQLPASPATASGGSAESPKKRLKQ